ncbi:MAG TPA: hypothetical protein PKD49_12840 [Hyphomicrobium sp.]|nr:hypothetical protein [Hyphomicrobium sp.]
MSRRNDRSRGAAGHFARGLLAASACALLVGCDDYLERRDTITLGVGDASAVNKATQTINRWPSAARQDRWLSDGERARSAVSRYRSRTVTPPAALDKGTNEDGNSILEKAPTASTGQ